MSEVEFKDAVGTPANVHAKKLAKEKSKKQADAALEAKFQKVVYTQLKDKVLQVTITPKGAYSKYVGNVNKHKAEFTMKKAQWEKDGVWIGQDNFEKESSKIREELAEKFAKAK